MNKRQAEILRILLESSTELYGLEIIRRSGVYANLKRSSIYYDLARLERSGYTISKLEYPVPEGLIIPRRLHKYTDKGTRIYNKWFTKKCNNQTYTPSYA